MNRTVVEERENPNRRGVGGRDCTGCQSVSQVSTVVDADQEGRQCQGTLTRCNQWL